MPKKTNRLNLFKWKNILIGVFYPQALNRRLDQWLPSLWKYWVVSTPRVSANIFGVIELTADENSEKSPEYFQRW